MVSLVKDSETNDCPVPPEAGRKAGVGVGPLKAVDDAFVRPADGVSARGALIVLIDPRPLTRASMSQLLAQGSPPQRRMEDFTVLPVASLEDFLAEPPVRAGHVAMVVYSLGAHCPYDENTPLDQSRLRRHYPDVPLVILSDCENPSHILAALKDGVRGYIPTALEPAMVYQAIRLVLAGGVFIPPSVIGASAEAAALVAAGNGGNGASAHTQGNGKAPIMGDFTPRQSEVFELLRQGKSNKVIAYELGMQESTVKVHVRQIMRKLKALNRTHAAFLANQMAAGEAGQH